MKKIVNVLSIVFVMLLFIMPGITAKAADSDISIYSRTTDSVTVHWNAVNDASGYYVGIGDTKDEAEKKADSRGQYENTTSHTFRYLSAGKNYYVCIKYFTNNIVNTLYTHGYIEIATITSAPTGLKQERWSKPGKTVEISWNKMAGADGYEVKIISDKNTTTTKETTQNKYTFSVDSEASYRINVRAFTQMNGSKQHSDYSDTLAVLMQPDIKETDDGFAVSVDKKKLKVKWHEQKAADGYEIYVSTKKNGGYKKVKTIGSNTKTSAKVAKFNGKKFNPKKKYYVYVVSYVFENGQKMTSGSNYVVCYANKKTSMVIKK